MSTVSGLVPIRATYLPRTDWAARGLYSDSTPAQRLADWARKAPDRAAVIDARSGSGLTFSELARDVRRLAAALRVRGVGPGDVVTMILPNWSESLVVFHAVAHLGAVLNPIVPIYREREVGFILRQARPKVVIVPETFRGFAHLDMVRGLAPDILVMAVRPTGPLPADVLSFSELVETEPLADSEPVVAAADVALLLYTSGTTADPKGVLHSHQTLSYEVQSFVEEFSLTADDAVFMPSPVTHITGLLYGLILPVITGCAVTLLDHWDTATAVTAVQRDQCRFIMGATPFLHGMVAEHLRRGDHSALTVFVCGGADVPPSLVRQATEVLGCHVARVYGSSEFPTLCCGRHQDSLEVRAETDGMPVGPVSYRIDDAVDGVGELVVDGPERFLGYLDADLNDAAFTADGMFRTGDLASIDDGGAVTIRGRLKDIILRGGENISAKEIEDLLHSHPGIEAVAIVAMPDPVLVERACAFVVPAAGVQLSLADLTTFLDGHRLAKQKLPERLEIVESLPVTASGKVQKYVLREQVRKSLDTTLTHQEP